MVEDSTYKLLLKDIARVEQHVSLGRFNGLGLGGRAAYFTEARDAMEVAGAVKAAIDANLPYEIVGSGSAILFPDDDYAGLIIHNRSEGFVMAADKSQVVVESGMILQRFITLAAGRGYGGMTQFYGLPGTIGGAVYNGLTVEGGSILSSIRHLTMLIPPTKMKPYPTVSRQRVDWLIRDDGQTKLRYLRNTRSFEQARPVILNVQFQLTSVRPDELQRRIQKEAELIVPPPRGEVFGPIFLEPGGGHKLAEVLKHSGVQRIMIDGIRADRKNLNYLCAKRSGTVMAVWRTVVAMQELVRERSGIEIKPAFERLGVWSATNQEAEAVVG